jgi:hypothetical protein
LRVGYGEGRGIMGRNRGRSRRQQYERAVDISNWGIENERKKKQLNKDKLGERK